MDGALWEQVALPRRGSGWRDLTQESLSKTSCYRRDDSADWADWADVSGSSEVRRRFASPASDQRVPIRAGDPSNAHQVRSIGRRSLRTLRYFVGCRHRSCSKDTSASTSTDKQRFGRRVVDQFARQLPEPRGRNPFRPGMRPPGRHQHRSYFAARGQRQRRVGPPLADDHAHPVGRVAVPPGHRARRSRRRPPRRPSPASAPSTLSAPRQSTRRDRGHSCPPAARRDDEARPSAKGRRRARPPAAAPRHERR